MRRSAGTQPQMQRILISVHYPKSAGTSLVRSLQAALGEDRVLLDYADNPADPGSRFRLDPVGFRRDRRRTPGDYAAIHGHFHPEKYALIEPRQRWLVTILREPVENLLSIYRFWRQLPSQGNALHDYFLAHDLSPLDLARLPLIGRLMTETYFGGWDMKSFDYIGDHAEYSRSVREIGELLGVSLLERVENVSPQADIDADTRRELADVLRDEIEFYERWRGFRRDAM
jgi:hypothetical protein